MESGLCLEYQFFHKPAGLAIAFSHRTGNALHVHLIERVIEDRPQVSTGQPVTSLTGDVAPDIRPVVVGVHHPGHQTPLPLPANGLGSYPKIPVIANPRSDPANDVGSSGYHLDIAPRLHHEVRRDPVQRDPRGRASDVRGGAIPHPRDPVPDATEEVSCP